MNNWIILSTNQSLTHPVQLPKILSKMSQTIQASPGCVTWTACQSFLQAVRRLGLRSYICGAQADPGLMLRPFSWFMDHVRGPPTGPGRMDAALVAQSNGHLFKSVLVATQASAVVCPFKLSWHVALVTLRLPRPDKSNPGCRAQYQAQVKRATYQKKPFLCLVEIPFGVGTAEACLSTRSA